MGFKTILSMNTKGGTGKTLTSCALAIKLSENSKVGLIDLDIDSSNVPEVLGISDKLKVDVKRNFVPFQFNENLQVFSMSLVIDDTKSISKTGNEYTQIILDAISNSVWDKNIDYFVCDLGGGSSDIFRTTRKIFGDTILGAIITTQIGVHNDLERTIDLASNNNFRVIGVIENMSYSECEKCGEKNFVFGESMTKEISDKYGLVFFGQIPLMKNIREKIKNKELDIYGKVVEKINELVKK